MKKLMILCVPLGLKISWKIEKELNLDILFTK